jgi:hypothetical protein
MLHTCRGIISGTLFALCAAYFLSVSAAYALDLNISVTIPGSSTPVIGGGGGGVVLPASNVRLSGLAFPGAILTFLRDGVVIGTDVAGGGGYFTREFLVSPGAATFGIWARDQFGFISPTVSVAFDIQDGLLADITSLALPPTIAHDSVSSNGSLKIYGSAFPGSTVRIFNNNAPFNPPFVATASGNGIWEYRIPRDGFNPRNFSYKANYQDEQSGILSPFSNDLTLQLSTCMNSDFSGDGVVNLTDLSILLFYWGRPVPTGGLSNACVDRNQDRVIDLQDFSILMYEWSLTYQVQ